MVLLFITESWCPGAALDKGANMSNLVVPTRHEDTCMYTVIWPKGLDLSFPGFYLRYQELVNCQRFGS